MPHAPTLVAGVVKAIPNWGRRGLGRDWAPAGGRARAWLLVEIAE